MGGVLHQKSTPKATCQDSVTLTKNMDVAEFLSKNFARNFSAAGLPECHSQHLTCTVFNVTYKEGYCALRATPNTLAGPDGISGKQLRDLSSALTLLVNSIFQQSVFQSTFPSQWKLATLIQIYKGRGAKDKASNYRPVSLCFML